MDIDREIRSIGYKRSVWVDESGEVHIWHLAIWRPKNIVIQVKDPGNALEELLRHIGITVVVAEHLGTQPWSDDIEPYSPWPPVDDPMPEDKSNDA